jgi:hypothetical protein
MADKQQVRAEGPATVVDGGEHRSRIIVLDPAGEAKHGELPATWRPLADQREIVWCRLPTDGALGEAEDLLVDTSGAGPRTDVVASGPVAAEAVRLAARHPGAIHSVLLVDPEPDVPETTMDVRVIARGLGDAAMPLGHPDVVAGLRDALSID